MSLISAPCPVRHRDAVAGGHIGIGRLLIHTAEPARREQHRPRPHRHQLRRVAVVHDRAAHPIAVRQQIDRGPEAAKRDVRQRPRFAVQRARDLAAGRIAMRVQDPAAAVRGFPREREAHPVAIELRAPFDELLDRRRSFLDQRVDRRDVAQPRAGRDRVLLMQPHLVVIAERDRDAALRIFRGGLPQAVLGDHQHRSRLRQFDGGPQSGDAGADHEEIGSYPSCDFNSTVTTQKILTNVNETYTNM